MLNYYSTNGIILIFTSHLTVLFNIIFVLGKFLQVCRSILSADFMEAPRIYLDS